MIEHVLPEESVPRILAKNQSFGLLQERIPFNLEPPSEAWWRRFFARSP
jgi:hypothetical protein